MKNVIIYVMSCKVHILRDEDRNEKEEDMNSKKKLNNVIMCVYR